MCVDDEDCIDGSGSGERNFQITSSSNNVHPVYGQSGHHNHHQTTKAPWPTWTPHTSPPIEEPPLVRNYPVVTTSDYETLFHFTSRPVTTAPVWSKPIYPISGPTRHPTVKPLVPQGPPSIYEVCSIN